MHYCRAFLPADCTGGCLCDVTAIPEAGLRVAQVIGAYHHHRQFGMGPNWQLPVHDAPEQVGRRVTCSPDCASVRHGRTDASAVHLAVYTPNHASTHALCNVLLISNQCDLHKKLSKGWASCISQGMHCIGVYMGQGLTANPQDLRCVVGPEGLVEDAHGGSPRCVRRWGTHSPLICRPVIPPPHCNGVPIE